MNPSYDSRASALADRTADAYRSRLDAPPSCSWLLEDAVRYMEKNVSPAKHVYAGFIIGQMEKVYLGACPAAMFNVPLDDYSLRAFVRDVAPVYHLDLDGNDYETCTAPTSREVWVWQHARPGVRQQVAKAKRLLTSEDPAERNEQAAHVLRGMLCGIPLEQIDPHWNPIR